jgi:hypothetical protein
MLENEGDVNSKAPEAKIVTTIWQFRASNVCDTDV